jgi:hypothetical protein
MSIHLPYPAGKLIQRRLQRLLRSTLRARIDALRTRLARHAMPRRDGLRRVPVRITPMERVMLRSATHLNRSFAAHVSLQALLSAGIARHTHRVETLQTRERAAQVHAPRHIERVLVTQRVPLERLVQRLTASTRQAALPRAAMVTRVEQHHVFPRVQLTLVRVLPAAPSAARVPADPSAVPNPGLRTAPAQQRGAATLTPLVLPPQELSRLTDHVIRQLDHRVLSYQERTGRV